MVVFVFAITRLQILPPATLWVEINMKRQEDLFNQNRAISHLTLDINLISVLCQFYETTSLKTVLWDYIPEDSDSDVRWCPWRIWQPPETRGTYLLESSIIAVEIFIQNTFVHVVMIFKSLGREYLKVHYITFSTAAIYSIKDIWTRTCIKNTRPPSMNQSIGVTFLHEQFYFSPPLHPLYMIIPAEYWC